MPSLPTSNREVEQYRQITPLSCPKVSMLFDLAVAVAAESVAAAAEGDAGVWVPRV